eukprot:NODE_3272_length_918_cov_54.498104_g3251_i0.p1 GENE.NODE_3272_length_918_cov_54.498104_g3251_i0~~NODE_3272_length_918_cov_54.498104_g3251_i0.p1  ORF type:complete len:278 (-),score=40.29 NODE_3272_length_918_cov_54.498104_g3251_i0:84-824(-)
MEFWVRKVRGASLPTSMCLCKFTETGDNAFGNVEFGVYLDAPTQGGCHIRVYVCDQQGRELELIHDDSTLMDGRWHHFPWRVGDAHRCMMQLYVDAVSVPLTTLRSLPLEQFHQWHDGETEFGCVAGPGVTGHARGHTAKFYKNFGLVPITQPCVQLSVLAPTCHLPRWVHPQAALLPLHPKRQPTPFSVLRVCTLIPVESMSADSIGTTRTLSTALSERCSTFVPQPPDATRGPQATAPRRMVVA